MAEFDARGVRGFAGRDFTPYAAWFGAPGTTSDAALRTTGGGAMLAGPGATLVHGGDREYLCAFDAPRAQAEALDGFCARLMRSPAAALRDLHGPFALAVLGADGSAILATDRFGVRPVYACLRPQGVILGFDVESVAAHPLVQRALDPQSIYDYLYFHAVPSPRTVYRDVFKVPPGHYLHYRDGKHDIVRYWQAEFRADPAASPADLATELKRHLRAAVAHAVTTPKVGAFLSGGLDSSTVAGMLGEATGKAPRTYSIGFGAQGYDEMEYARIVARHFGAEHHEYYVTPADVTALLPRLGTEFDGPFGNDSAVPTYYCAQLAQQDGVALLLAGDGGDELFGGNARYAKQLLFEHYARAPAPLRRVAEALLLNDTARGIPGIAKLHSYIAQALIPLPGRMESYNLLERIGPENLLAPDLLAAVDRMAPHRHLDEVYAAAIAGHALDRMLALDWKTTLTDSDLPKVSCMTRAAGVAVAYPMLDEAVVDFSCRVPAGLKIRRGRLRHFYKEALSDYLPQATIDKRKHGFGLPTGHWINEQPALNGAMRELLAALESRGVLRQGCGATLFATLPQHPPYYGKLIWVLGMLELWLQARAPSYRFDAGKRAAP